MNDKISGALNNCGLHIAVPSVITHLNLLADSDAPKSNPFYETYEQLRQLFCRYYSLPEQTNFKEIHQFIHQKSFIAQQLILGPVLRTLIDENYRKTLDPLDPFQASELDSLPEEKDDPTPAGRFRAIELNTLIEYLFDHLGITVDAVYAKEESEGVYAQDTNFKPSKAGGIYPIQIYNANSHYELSDSPIDASCSANDPYADFETKFANAASETDESQIYRLEDQANAEIPQRSRAEITQAVKQELKNLKQLVKIDFQSPRLSHTSQSIFKKMKDYVDDYKKHLHKDQELIKKYSEKSEDFYSSKAEVLETAIGGNLKALFEAAEASPLDYAELRAYIPAKLEDFETSEALTQKLKEALLENDRQLAEKLQWDDYKQSNHFKPQ